MKRRLWHRSRGAWCVAIAVVACGAVALAQGRGGRRGGASGRATSDATS